MKMPERGSAVLALLEPGRRGAVAVEYAARLATAEAVAVTVVSVVPAATRSRCGNSVLDYNLAVEDLAARDLEHAREGLARIGAITSYRLLVENRDPSLAQFASEGGFHLVVLPSRRRTWTRALGHRALRHPAARSLRSATRAEVRVVAHETPERPVA